MPATLLDEPLVIDVELELLVHDGRHWEPVRESVLSVGDRIALRCLNRADREVDAALLARRMDGALRTASQYVQSLEPGRPTILGGSSHGGVALEHEDVQLVLAVSNDWGILDRLLAEPAEENSIPTEDLVLRSVPLRARSGERPISHGDLGPLLNLMRHPDDEMAVLATAAVGLLSPTRSDLRRYACETVRDALRDTMSSRRPAIIDAAANFGDAGVREHLQGICDDETDRHRWAAIRALAQIGDLHTMEHLRSGLDGTRGERLEAARLIVTSQQEVPEIPEREDDHGSIAFWRALASARRGDVTGIDSVLGSPDTVSVNHAIGDRSNLYLAIRGLPPLSPPLREHLETQIYEQPLTPPVREFYEALLAADSRGTDPACSGRDIPERASASVRDDLYRIPTLHELDRYTRHGDGWARVAGLGASQLGVLLADLVGEAVREHTPTSALTVVDELLRGWHGRAWYPDLTALLDIARDASGRARDDTGRHLFALLGWALSRAPVARTLRLVNERIQYRSVTDGELRALVSAILTQWDDAPPPVTGNLQRLPRRVQQMVSGTLDEHRAEAWVEHPAQTDTGWSFTLRVSVAQRVEEPNILVPRTSPEAVDEGFTDLIVSPWAPGATFAPTGRVVRVSGSVAGATAEFEGRTENSDVRLRVALYQQRPGLLLQEFEGLVRLE